MKRVKRKYFYRISGTAIINNQKVPFCHDVVLKRDLMYSLRLVQQEIQKSLGAESISILAAIKGTPLKGMEVMIK